MSLKKIKESAFDYLFVLLIFILPFSLAIPNLVLGVLIFYFLISLRTLKSTAALKHNSLLLLCVFFAYLFLKAIVNNTLITDSGLYSRYLLVIVILVLFLKVRDPERIKVAMIIATVALMVKSVYMIIQFYLVYHTFPLGDGNLANTVLVIERPYAGFMALISVLLSLEQFQKQQKSKWHWAYFLFCSFQHEIHR